VNIVGQKSDRESWLWGLPAPTNASLLTPIIPIQLTSIDNDG